MNAIHALSQLSYAPETLFKARASVVARLDGSPCGRTAYKRFRREPRNLPEGRIEVKQKGLAQTSEADILQRLLSLKKEPAGSLSGAGSNSLQRSDAPPRHALH